MYVRWLSGKRKRILYLLALLPLLSLLATHSFSQIATPTPNVELGTGTAYESLTFGTYLTWSNTIYAQSVAYYPNQINFTDASYASTSGPTFSFGLGTEYANATITGITSNSLKLSTGAAGFGSSYSLVYFYFTSSEGSPAIIYVNSTSGNTQIPSSIFYSNLTQFQSSSAPSVYLNNSASLVEAKLAGSSSLLFYYLPGTTTTSTSSSPSSTSTTSSSSSSSDSTSSSSTSTTTVTSTHTSTSTTTSTSTVTSTSTTTSTITSSSTTTRTTTITTTDTSTSTVTSTSTGTTGTSTAITSTQTASNSTTTLASLNSSTSSSLDSSSTNSSSTASLLSNPRTSGATAVSVGVLTYEVILAGGMPAIVYYSRRKSNGSGGWKW